MTPEEGAGTRDANVGRWAVFSREELSTLLECIRASGNGTRRQYDLEAEIHTALHPQPPTPEERATTVARAFFRSYKGFDSVPSHIEGKLVNEIAAAIYADREARSKDVGV